MFAGSSTCPSASITAYERAIATPCNCEVSPKIKPSRDPPHKRRNSRARLHHPPHPHADRRELADHPVAASRVVGDVGFGRGFEIDAGQVRPLARLIAQIIEYRDSEMAALERRIDAEHIEVKMRFGRAVLKQHVERSHRAA